METALTTNDLHVIKFSAQIPALDLYLNYHLDFPDTLYFFCF